MNNSIMQTQTRPQNIEGETTGLQVNRKRVNMTRVLLMDDDYLFLECLEHALSQDSYEFRIVGKTAANADSTRMVSEVRPDVVVVGIHPEKDEGIEVVETLHDEYPNLKVIVLNISEDENDLTRLLKAGISAYLLRTCSIHKLAESILAVASGDCVLTPSMAGKLMEILRRQNRYVQNEIAFSLSDREKEILRYAAIGDSNKEIAQKCFIRETTVKSHFRNILHKMDAKNRAEAVALATSMRILPKISPQGIGACI